LVFLVVPLLLLTGPAQPTGAAGTIAVTTTNDELGSDPGCSLREAIQSANQGSSFDNCTGAAASGGNTITVPAGTYTITRPGLDDTNSGGDFDVTSVIEIRPSGNGPVTIHGGGIDRVFHVLGGANLTLSGVTVTGGDAQVDTYAGGIFVSAGTLAMQDSTLSHNQNALFGVAWP
jgi:CSLREA domain-containing protein